MNDLFVFFAGAASGAAALIQYLTSRYRFVPKEQITLTYLEKKFPFDHPAKNQAIRQILYNTTPDRHRTLRKQDE